MRLQAVQLDEAVFFLDCLCGAQTVGFRNYFGCISYTCVASQKILHHGVFYLFISGAEVKTTSEVGQVIRLSPELAL
jgi:hypothetical protein